MKKIFCVALALIMLLALAVPAFAAGPVCSLCRSYGSLRFNSLMLTHAFHITQIGAGAMLPQMRKHGR